MVLNLTGPLSLSPWGQCGWRWGSPANSALLWSQMRAGGSSSGETLAGEEGDSHMVMDMKFGAIILVCSFIKDIYLSRTSSPRHSP